MGFKYLFLLIVFILSLTFVSANNYYADVQIFVGSDGSVSFEGTTNHPDLEGRSQAYTSKKGEYWLLNISLEGVFSDFIYELHLPKNADINYLKTPELAQIQTDSDGLVIIGTGENEPFEILVQYSINYDVEKTKSLMYIVIAVIIIVIGYYLIFKKKRNKLTYDPETLTRRQNLIMNVIRKSKPPVTQAFIEKTTGLPKASLSRNIESLKKKGIIKKYRRGMSNIISIKK
ncbi:MAG: MarR family transcriptional regulator [archaeon]